MMAGSAVMTSAAQAGELLTNGGFETGNTSGWLTDHFGYDEYPYFNGVKPNSPQGLNVALPLPIVAQVNPLGGNFVAAMTPGPIVSLSVFAHDFVVPDGVTHLRLSFDSIVLRQLSESGAFDVQHGGGSRAFVDILPGAVNPYAQTQDGFLTVAEVGPAWFPLDPNGSAIPLAWTTSSYEINNLAPGAYNLRFAAMRSDFFFDNVSLTTEGSVVPEPSSWALTISGAALVGAALRRRRAVLAT
jgi:hypothetical protein